MGIEKSWQVAATATDTVWGLVCRTDSDQARDNIKRIYAIKQREASKPLILFGRDSKTLKAYAAEWGEVAENLASKHWPGALTIIVRRSSLLPDWVNPAEEYIGLRVPNSPSVFQLLDQVTNGVLLSTSANLSAELPVRDYREACTQFKTSLRAEGEAVHYVDLIHKPHEAEVYSNKASTIVKITGDKLEILRQGDIKVSI